MAEVKINTQTQQFDRVYHIPKEQLANALRAIPHNGADDYVFRIEDQYYVASRRGESIPTTGQGVIRFRSGSHDSHDTAHTNVSVDSILSQSKYADGVVKYQGKTGFMVAVDDEINTRAEGKAQTPLVTMIQTTAGGGLLGMFTGAGAVRLAEAVLTKASGRTHNMVGVGVGLATMAAVGTLPVLIDRHVQGKKAEAKVVDLDMLAPFANQVDE